MRCERAQGWRTIPTVSQPAAARRKYHLNRLAPTRMIGMLAADRCHHEFRIGEQPGRRRRALLRHLHRVAHGFGLPEPLSNLDQLTV